MVSLAVGGLFGDAFIHLLPQSFEKFHAKVEASLGSWLEYSYSSSLEVSSLETSACSWNPIIPYILWGI